MFPNIKILSDKNVWKHQEFAPKSVTLRARKIFSGFFAGGYTYFL